MFQSICRLRVGVEQIQGWWESARSQGSRVSAAAARFDHQNCAPNLQTGETLKSILSTILPPRRIGSPFVTVALAGTHVSSAIMSFVKLPKSAADRTLLISQRFCREHRLDFSSTAVLGSSLGTAKGGDENVLCFAVQQSLLAEILLALAAHGLHADAIAPEYLLNFAEADTRDLEAPGMALLHREDCCDFLLWDADGAIVHIASIELIGKDEFDIRRRLAARIRRYSEIVGKDGAGCAVYSNGQFDREAFDLAFLGTGPMLRPWPGSTSRQSRNLKVRL